MTKCATYAYLPPHRLPYSEAFYNNILHFRHTHELHLFSDHKWDCAISIQDPELVKYAREDHGAQKLYAVSNLLFLTALRMAHADDVTHMLYLEADCRVGCDGWDGFIFEEFAKHKGALNGGFLMVWNPSFGGRAVKVEFDKAMVRWLKNGDGFGPDIYSDRREPCVYANGCASIINVAWAVKEFGVENTVQTATRISAWDLEIGRRLWAEFGPATYGKVAHLKGVFSTYADTSSTEAERIQMLRDGRALVAHQVKSSIAYP